MEAYNLLIRFGRYLDEGKEFKPEVVLSTVEYIDRKLRWTPVKDFFRLFPPIKDYDNESGWWDYQSTLEMIKNDFGKRFGKDDFKHLLMNACYENRFVQEVGVAYLKAIRRMSIRKIGRDPVAEFLNEI
ncbi:hypothetical protein [Tuberibacillus calidus]|jgi:hypothetical protein|uniref:hypothetical protein n=1 Tax=Tuberibacillus calidus TaxID=340097 RepID=UPI0004094046|nr:hypothetical protein [Tuberibacillus calidus]